MSFLTGLMAVSAWLAGCGGTDLATVGTPDSLTTGATSTNQSALTKLELEWNMTNKITKTEDEWRKELTPEQFHVLRQEGTERAFTGKLWNNHETGIYYCAGCGLALFDSSHKFESGTGWPSFWQPLKSEHVGSEEDNSLFARRTEVHCARCGGHLGHVFEDGPKPTGLRYCINSAALTFAAQKDEQK